MRLPIAYSFLFVATAHLAALTALWTASIANFSANSTSPPTSISAVPSITATLLSAAPLPKQKSTQQQTHRPVISITSRQNQAKITQPTVATVMPALSSEHHSLPSSSQSVATQTLTAPSNAADTLKRKKRMPISAISTTLRTVQHLDCSITQPRYPVLSRQREETGITLIKMIVSAYGDIEQATVIQSSGSQRLDYAAREAVLASTCNPYRLNGQPLRAAVNVRFKFNLND